MACLDKQLVCRSLIQKGLQAARVQAAMADHLQLTPSELKFRFELRKNIPGTQAPASAAATLCL